MLKIPLVNCHFIRKPLWKRRGYVGYGLITLVSKHRLVYKTRVTMRVCPTTPHLKQKETKFCQWFPFGLWNAYWLLCPEVFFMILSVQDWVWQGHVPRDAGRLGYWRQAEGLRSVLCPVSVVLNNVDLVHLCTAVWRCPALSAALQHHVIMQLLPGPIFLLSVLTGLLRKLLRGTWW